MSHLRLPLLLALLCALLSLPAQAASFTASVDRTQLNEGETVDLTLQTDDVTLFGKPDLAPLESLFDVLGNPGAVVARVEIAFFEVQTQTADFCGLREGTDGRGRPCRQVKACTLGSSTYRISISTLAILRGNRCQTFFNHSIVDAG